MIDPSELVQHTFLGLPCGKGVAAAFRDHLVAVEAALEHKFGQRGRALGALLGVGAGLICYRHDGGRHGLGRAIDIEYARAPYIAMRTAKAGGGWIYGGEAAAAGLHGLREAALAACDRACAFADPTGGPADLSARRRGEGTSAVWDRLRRVSDAWRTYFGAAFVSTPSVSRKPGTTPAPTELQPHDQALATIAARVPTRPADEVLAEIIADFDAVRIPTVFGMPSRTPAKTRNPVRGFLPFARELAVAMVEVGGMRWGACDFGPAESGDVMHFDR